MNFWFWVWILLIVIIIGLVIWFIFFAFFGIFKKTVSAPYISSFDKDILLMKNNLSLEKWKTLVDLWCGDAKALRFFVKTFGIVGYWYDINNFAIFFGRTLNFLLGFSNTIFLFKKNFLNIDLSQFDYIYLYLFPQQLVVIEDWIWKTMKEDAVIISNSFQFKKHHPFQIIKNKKGKSCIFLYRK